MRTLAPLDLREVVLADGLARLGFNPPHQFLLREGAIHAAEGTFDLAEVANFFSERHISQIEIIISQYEILCQGLVLFAMAYGRLPRCASKASPKKTASAGRWRLWDIAVRVCLMQDQRHRSGVRRSRSGRAGDRDGVGSSGRAAAGGNAGAG